MQKFQNMAKRVCFDPHIFIRWIQLCDKMNLASVDSPDKILLNLS